jgi:hypothetical protein
MNKKNVFIFLLLIFTAAANLAGQALNTTQFPSDIRWKQIETERFLLIFPEELKQKAAEIAEDIESLYPPVEASLNTSVTKWPIILNSSLTISNGYVAGAPNHSQLYTLPPQDGFNGTGDWLSFLWSHELRHIVQNEKMKRGFTEIASWLAGEYGWSGMTHFALPRMFWEGDAVLSETLLGESGRGRLPDFERGLRTNLLSGIRFKYNKSALGYYGSYKDNVQSWYVTGYHFCTYIRKEYGIEAFNKILEIAADFSFTPLILNIAVQNVTGKSVEGLYEECLDELTGLWQDQLENTPKSKITHIRAGGKDDIINYYPLGIMKSSGNITALKTSASHRYQLIEIMPDGTDKILKTINPADSPSFNGIVFCWSEQKKDIRWGNRSWSVIRIYNPATSEDRLITDRTRYFAPSISPDSRFIAAAEYTEELDSVIVVLDAETGRLIRRFPQPDGAVALQPCWNDDGSSIIYIRQHNNRKALYKIDYPMGTDSALTEPSTLDISSPSESGGWVYYVSGESGVDQIHTVSLNGDGKYLAVSTRFGAASPVSGTDKQLILSDYTEWGWALSETDISEEHWIPAESIENNHVDYFSDLGEEEPFEGFLGRNSDKSEHSENDYTAEDYWPIAGFFNFHSTGIGTTANDSGILLYFQADDIMNYSSNQVYSGWDPVNSKIIAGIAGAYGGFFPMLLYGAELGTPAVPLGSSIDAFLYGGAAIPFNFSEGNQANYLTVQSVFFFNMQLMNPETAVNSTFNWQNTELKAKKDILPPSGYSLKGRWYYSLDPNIYNYISGETIFYLPGFSANHGLSLGLKTEYNFPSSLQNMPAQKLPRGITSSGINYPILINASVNYSFPISYPDICFGSVLYIPRVYMNIFYDSAAGFSQPEQLQTLQNIKMINTAGFELFADFHLFNNIVPLKTGLRFIYNFQTGVIRFEDTVFMFGFSLP